MTDMNGAMGAPPRQRLRPWHIILIVLGGLALLGGGLYVILSWALGPMVQSGNDFMGALRDRQFDRAYALSSPALQREVGDAARMGAAIGIYQPAEWTWSTRSVRNGVGRLEGAVTYNGGRSGSARLQLEQVDGQWRVVAYRLN
jgi:hypothetical protein